MLYATGSEISVDAPRDHMRCRFTASVTVTPVPIAKIADRDRSLVFFFRDAQTVPMQELLEVGAIELGESGRFGHRGSLGHQIDEVAPLEFRGGLTLGFGEWLDRSFRSPRRTLTNRRVVAPLRAACKDSCNVAIELAPAFLCR
jgi:hypothetical protein